MGIEVEVHSRLDLPICNECQMAEIEVDHELAETYGCFLKMVIITVECAHYEACKRAAFMAEQAQEVE